MTAKIYIFFQFTKGAEGVSSRFKRLHAVSVILSVVEGSVNVSTTIGFNSFNS